MSLPKLVVLEDDAPFRESIKARLLESYHGLFEIVLAGTSAAAVAAIEHDTAVKAVLCDLQLAPNDKLPATVHSHTHHGFAVARWARQLPHKPAVYGMTQLFDDVSNGHNKFFIEAADDETGVGVYHKHLGWPLLRHRLLKRLGRTPAVTVFIVHGHDPEHLSPPTHEELADWVKSTFRWKVVIISNEDWNNESWMDQIEAGAEAAQLAFVVMTPDEWGCPIRAELPPERRPRPNVLFEAGYFFGAFGRRNRRVIAFCRGDLRKPTDIDGLPHIDLHGSVADNEARIRQEVRAWL